MADRIFPNTYQDEPLDSDLVFKGIDWDNFNQKLAEVKSAPANELPDEFKEVLAGKKKSEDMPEEVEEMFKEKSEKSKPSKKDRKDLSDVPPELRKYVEEKQDKMDDEEDDDSDDEEDDDKKDSKYHKGKMKKKASPFVFNHPSQLSAEAVEAAIEAGDDRLKDAILAARHERRVRLASKIEEQIEAENEFNEKLNQRRAYRESLVAKVANSEKKSVKTAKSESDDFVKVSSADNRAKRAFAAKALAEGFPQEYVDAILGNNVVEADNTVEIRNVMSSELSDNIKKSAVASMVKTATLTDADYSRLIRYWKEELGYGDQEWIDALFTKKYD